MEMPTTFVISDLHVGIGDSFDIFFSPEKLKLFAGFIDYARAQHNPVELIINGDIVDFLQVRPWGDYTRPTALAKIKAIASQNEEVWKTLGGLLRDPRHRITVLLGNHDVELAFPEVWMVLRDAILAGSPQDSEPRLNLIRDRTTYRPTINGVLVNVEHGNKDDQWNSINYANLFNDAETGTSEFAYPPGTKFVYDTMNDVKDQLRFVDVLKPEVPAVLLLLTVLRPWKTVLSLPAAATSKLRALGNGWLSKLRQAVGGPTLGPASMDDANPEKMLVHEIARSYATGVQQKLSKALCDDIAHYITSEEEERPLGQLNLGSRLDTTKERMIAAALWVLVRFRAQLETGSEFAAMDYPDDPFAVSARGRLVGKVKVVIYGHTHEALKTEFDDGCLYVNSGAWANLVKLPKSKDFAELFRWSRKLADNTFERTAFPTFVRIDPSDGGVIVGLHLWKAKDEELWKKDISRSE